MKFIDYFDRIYIINLPSRKDRLKQIIEQLKRAGLWDNEQKTRIFQGIRPDDTGGFETIGSRGCFLSHLEVLKLAYKDQLKNVLIIEDDLLISPQFKKVEENLIAQLSGIKWGFIYFGQVMVQPPGVEFALRQYNEILTGAHFYGINSIIFPRLLSYLEEILKKKPGEPGGPMYGDAARWLFRKQNPDIVTMIATPTLGVQTGFNSDTYIGKWFERAFLIGNCVSFLKRIKRYITQFILK